MKQHATRRLVTIETFFCLRIPARKCASSFECLVTGMSLFLSGYLSSLLLPWSLARAAKMRGKERAQNIQTYTHISRVPVFSLMFGSLYLVLYTRGRFAIAFNGVLQTKGRSTDGTLNSKRAYTMIDFRYHDSP